MTSRVSQDVDLRQGFVRSLEERREPGPAEGSPRVLEEVRPAAGRVGGAGRSNARPRPRAAGPPPIPEVRCPRRGHGAPFFLPNPRGPIDSLGPLAALPRDAPPEFPAARTRLLDRLHTLLEDAPRRVRLMKEYGGPDTPLHGDLWPKNIFVSMNAAAPHPRLIDWDPVGAGPVSYGCSTLPYQSSPDERPWMLRRYRKAVERAGRRLASDAELNVMFHTAETARYAHSILFDAMALLNDRAGWGCAGPI